MGSPYSWRTCAWVVLPLTNCARTVSCEASAILSLPLLAQPARSADESPTATKIRHAITPPTAVASGTVAHRPSSLPEHHLPPLRRIPCGPIPVCRTDQ